MERRRHNRICTSIPVKIHGKIPESPEFFWTDFGVLKNLSYKGAYRMFNDIPLLEQGQILYFTITPTEGHLDFPGANFINGTSRVVRIDSPKAGDHDFGVALDFIPAKFLDFLIKSG